MRIRRNGAGGAGEAVGAHPRINPPRGPLGRARVRRSVKRRLHGDSLSRSEFGVFSQNGEDGVLQSALQRLGVNAGGFFVEVGSGGGSEGNCVLLADYYGWRGVFVERSSSEFQSLEWKYSRNPRVVTRRADVRAENIEAVLHDACVPSTFDVLSIDIDGNDFWVWDALRMFRARIVIVEYNGSLDVRQELVMPRDDNHQWDGTDYFGASLGAYGALGRRKGYRLIYTDRTGTNAFFVDASDACLFPEHVDPPERYANYYGQGLRHLEDPSHRPFLDVRSGHLVDAARIAAPVEGRQEVGKTG